MPTAARPLVDAGGVVGAARQPAAAAGRASSGGACRGSRASGQAEIRFTAGFGEAWDEVPADLRQAVFLLAAHFYENRAEGAVSAGSMPFGVLVLIEAYRATRIGGGLS